MHMEQKTIIPVLNREEIEKTGNTASGACSSCSGGCCGGFGIKAGSEKNIVYRNIFLYMTMGIVMFVVAYLLTRVLSLIIG